MNVINFQKKLVKFTLYSVFLFTITPLVIGLLIPWFYAPEEIGGKPTQLTENIFYRIVMLSSTGLIVTVLSIFIFALFFKWTRIQKIYTFLLLPLCIIGETTQLIVYREFGQEINVILLDLFRADLSTLWTYACREYHLISLILITLVGSFLFTHLINSKKTFFFLPKATHISWLLGGVSILVWTFGIALRNDIANKPYFHPDKTSRSPIFQLAKLALTQANIKQNSYESILSRTQKTNSSTYEEITTRLQSSPETFVQQTTQQPNFLKTKPSHIFLFLLESFAYNLIDDPTLSPLAPNLNKYHKTGISTDYFFAAGHCTIEAVHSIFSGASPIELYPTLQYPIPKTITRYKLDTFPRLMDKAGYTPLFYAASHRKFRYKGDISEAYGFKQFIGCPDVAPEIKSNEWGVCDGDFFNWVYPKVSHFKKPHFITFLNDSNHVPFDAPLDSITIPHFSKKTISNFLGRTEEEKKIYAQHIFYADYQLGKMVDLLKKQYPNSLFIFIGDHDSRNMTSLKRGRVPFILWNPTILKSIDTSDWYGSQMDLTATIANLILPSNTSISTLGRPVWDQSENRVSLTCLHAITKFGQIDKTHQYAGNQQTIYTNKTTLSQKKVKPFILKASAIEALSWGFLYSKPLQ